MKHLSIDLETFSSVPILKSGMYKYVQSSDFEILLMAYSVDNSPVQIIDLAQGEKIPKWLQEAIESPEYIKHAYNASFEWYCLSRYLKGNELLPVNQWRDTMLHGLYCGFTAGLDATGKALGLPEDKRKLAIGKSLIRYFSIPCAPTKTNGGRTRNYPKHDPEKWNLFKEYCKGDVVTEMEIERKLSNFPVSDDVQKQWETDLIINSRGVAVDMELVHGALNIANSSREKLINEAIKITGLENPNSVAQLSKWLETEIEEKIYDLRKDTVVQMLKRQNLTSAAERILQIRQELGKTSNKKYDAIETAVCNDYRVRGLLQFYGANRTGRWAGRLIQIQNVTRTYIDVKQLPLAREIVKRSEGDKLNILYGSVMNTLSQLIRTSFVAAEGKTLVDADFSSIEARVIAWLAQENWKIKIFENNGDVYCATASSMFGVPVEKHGANSELRQKGKIAELACIAEGQLVLTDKGLVPIELITTEHCLWDGEEWVKHDGIIYRGEKEVIEYEGLTATTDHLVWVEGQAKPIQFGIAAACGAHILQTGNGRTAIRLGENYQPRKTLESKLELLLRSNRMYKLRQYSVADSKQSNERQVERLSTVLATSPNSEMAGQKINCCKTTLRKSERPGISELRSKRRQICLSKCTGRRIVDFTEFVKCKSEYGIGQNQQQRQLRTRQFAFCVTTKKCRESTDNSSARVQPTRMALCPKCGNSYAYIRNDTRPNNSVSENSRNRKTQELAKYCRKAKVYDIRNAGCRHRFTVSDKLVHNCGYGGGAGALIAMGALDMGIPEEDLQDIVTRWRQANKRIVELWYKVENAAVSAIQTGQQTGVNGLIFTREFDVENNLDFLTIQLPSGRKLYYAHPEIAKNQWDRPVILYQGVNQTTKQWTTLETYGGKIVENIIQAIARDCLAVAIENLEKAGYPIVFHVHDEVVIECDKNKADLDKVVEIMTSPIDWAQGLPINADGWVGDFFRKD